MAWCPNCKNEYREGILICADCGAELVDSLDTVEESNNIIDEYIEADEDFIEETSDSDTDIKESDYDEDIINENNRFVYKPAYIDTKTKAEDNRTSAVTLLFVGILGLVVIGLILAGIIPFYNNSLTVKYLISGVMGVLFVLFIIMGALSIKNFKRLTDKAKGEDSLLKEIKLFCDETVTKDFVDSIIEISDDIPDEQKYFLRTAKMKEIISDKFMNLDDDMLDQFIDDFYSEIFE